MLTTRACRWATEQLRREHGSITGLARQLATTWRTVWTSIEPILARAARRVRLHRGHHPRGG
ncbi:helix-turn-helix domain-containing protein [Luteococcus peritonei]|uniref:Helix-turn-helix domain-containing protein n=2 Tax=Luteococcus peritonei TaxID=88874 RepID=A0ABW4RWC1_9ACTN